MVIMGELEIIQGIPIDEEDEDGEDGYGAAIPMGADFSWCDCRQSYYS
jgi:hypothetical protein